MTNRRSLLRNVLKAILPCGAALAVIYHFPVLSQAAAIGDVVTFGRYAATRERERQPISWIVLDKDAENSSVLLLSEKCIETFPYHVPAAIGSENPNMITEAVSWKDCSLRQQLNLNSYGGFYYEAFDDAEKALILETTVTQEPNGHFGTQAGEETVDRLFLLSESEVEKYLPRVSDRICYATEYLLEVTKIESNDDGTDRQLFDTSATTDACYWWLRTPGESEKYAECVGAEGHILQSGLLVNQIYAGIRPAVWVSEDAFANNDQGGSNEP